VAAPASERTGLSLYFAPRQADALEATAAETPARSSETSPQAPAAPKTDEPDRAKVCFAPIQGKSFAEIFRTDVRAAPSAVWRGTKYSFANAENLVVLSLAFGADRIVRNNLDKQVRDELRRTDTSMSETGDFGSVIGNPALHLGIGAAWYLCSVAERDARGHEFSKTMLEALSVTGLSTVLLKASVHDRSPNGERWSWPSGHMSSSICFASVIHEYYGWQAALPLYLLAGYSGASRLEDREHNLSDLVFGGALGWVIGHSVVKGELPQVAGFYVLPWGGGDGGGVMLVRRW
jgi:hypothetical protein